MLYDMKKIHLDTATLNGLADVSSDDSGSGKPPAHSDLNEKGENPKYCRISLFSNNEDEQSSLYVSKTVPNPTNYRIKELIPPREFFSEEYVTQDILHIIKVQVQKYGTIKEIRIVGHGADGIIGMESQIEIDHFLHSIKNLERDLKVKIADRIVFDACNTFSRTSDDKIKFYSDFAKDHHMQIVGTTSLSSEHDVLGLHVHSGRYVQFSPNGKIIRDELDTRYNPDMLFLSNDRSWTDFYIGQTPEQGMANKRAYEAKQENDVKFIEKQLKMEKYGPKY
jgi:hypothetical protein